MQNAYPLGAEAQDMQGHGRNGDTMLMHVSPEEVSGLQALAQANGTTLTINPDTGMPEAFSLKKLLPALAGAALTIATGGAINPLTIAAVVGGVKGIASGSLKKGLMAGLQAYGGASLGTAALGAGTAAVAPQAAAMSDFGVALGGPSAAQAAGAVAPNALASAAGSGLPASAGIAAAAPGIAAAAPGIAAAAPIGAGYTPSFSATLPFNMKTATAAEIAKAGIVPSASNMAGATGLASSAPVVFNAAPTVSGLTSMGAPNIAAPGMGNIVGRTLGSKAGMFADRFATAARDGLPPGVLSKYAPTIAGMGLMQGVSGAFAPKMPKPTAENNFNYEGPYVPPYREISYPSSSRDPNDSSEYLYFRNNNRPPGYVPYSKAYPARQTIELDPRRREENYGFAKGGMHLEDGAFIVDARTVSELGNGSSGAGQERLKRLGGQPIKGGGDGVSDSIRANIGGRQDARVARDEVKFSPQAVARIGKGNQKRGSDRLYALMAKAEKARKSAKRGQDTGLASLLRA